jgi:hypothetical protein
MPVLMRWCRWKVGVLGYFTKTGQVDIALFGGYFPMSKTRNWRKPPAVRHSDQTDRMSARAVGAG